MSCEGKEDEDDWYEKGRGHPGNCVRLEDVELDPAQDHYLNLKESNVYPANNLSHSIHRYSRFAH